MSKQISGNIFAKNSYRLIGIFNGIRVIWVIKFIGLTNLRIEITIYKAAGFPIITPQTSETRITVPN